MITPTPRPPPPDGDAPPRADATAAALVLHLRRDRACESSRNDITQPAVREAGPPAECTVLRVSGERSAEEACREALERLEAENPRINAVVAWDGERALAEARERDGLPHVWRGPLHGVPFTAKDLTDATPYATTYGSLAFADNVPVARRRLRRAPAPRRAPC